MTREEKYKPEKKIDYFELWEEKKSKSKIKLVDIGEKLVKTNSRKTILRTPDTPQMKQRRDELEASREELNRLHTTRALSIKKNVYGSVEGRREELLYIKEMLKVEVDKKSVYQPSW